ncbi:ATP-binding protein [Uliginosibacterium flavum]|uniref:histidine kinase n=1 Tax=Uliginosibacterium flavum TaxID=1396831 RepID=A0ABV2TQB6_9RHOO
MRLAIYSIRRRLLLVLAVAISVATLAQAGISYRVALREVDAISDYQMLQIANAVRRGVPEPTLSPLKRQPRKGEEPSYRLKVQLLPELRGGGGNALGTSNTVQVEQGFSMRQIDNKTFRVFLMPMHNKLIEVTQNIAERDRSARELALRTVLPILSLAPFMLGGVWWSISRALRPLMKSRDEVALRDANDLHALPTEGVPEEIQPFIASINAQFARVSKAFAAQQHFVADAAHELRSPLAALRLQVQGLQRAGSVEMRTLCTERLMAGIDRSTRLIEQLLVLAREEATAPERTRVSLPQALRLALSDVLPQAQAREINISANLAEIERERQLTVSGNLEALRILLRNLLENAVKNTPVQGVIKLSMQCNAEGIVLILEDSGPGIPAEERAQVFRRFNRGRSHSDGGSGLGLAIVQTIANRYCISMELGQSETLGGLAVKLKFMAV